MARRHESDREGPLIRNGRARLSTVQISIAYRDWFGLTLTVLLAAVLFLLLPLVERVRPRSPCEANPSQREVNAKAVVDGMAIGEVEVLLGPAGDYRVTNGGWYIDREELVQEVRMCKSDMAKSPEAVAWREWMFEAVVIDVGFDRNGRVVERRLYTRLP